MDPRENKDGKCATTTSSSRKRRVNNFYDGEVEGKICLLEFFNVYFSYHFRSIYELDEYF